MNQADDAPLRILVLDDSPAQLASVEEALSEAGYLVKTAATPAEAAEHLAESDLVIVDYHMPGTTGPEAVSLLRGRRSKSDVAYYLYTVDTEQAVSYRNLGFDGAFTRKGDAGALAEQVESAARLIRMKRFMATRRKG